MGVFEGHHLSSSEMHWQQGERQQMLAAAYDPSRDLSPNLPCQSSGSGPTGGGELAGEQGTSSDSSSVESGACCLSGAAGSSELGSSPRPSALPKETEDVVVCAGCQLRITDRYYLYAVDRRWHASCLQCSHCRLPLDGEVTCFSREGSIFCKKDYYRLFGMKRCARCQAAISSSELVMRARDLVFHVHCFTCAACSALLTKGDTFGLRDGAVLCRLHLGDLSPGSPYARLAPASPYPGGPHLYHHPRLSPPPGSPQQPVLAPLEPGKMSGAPQPPPQAFFPNGAPQPQPRQKGRPRKRKPKDLEGMTAGLDLNAESYLDVAFGPGTPGLPGGPNGAHHPRTKRMRTSFKHHQLRTMKSYFAINHNPDAKDLKQLSSKTGLPKRVLQVWFQNARAKWRRMVLKQESGGGKDKLDLGGGPGGGLDGYHPHHHPGLGGGGGGGSSPYLSPSPLECSS